jgi:hypothetical protein
VQAQRQAQVQAQRQAQVQAREQVQAQGAGTQRRAGTCSCCGTAGLQASCRKSP